ncbi:MAG: cytochrome c3 family protein [Candidatus Aminicenantales bacterium]|jgi:predicted CXXCH cytochrome family protein
MGFDIPRRTTFALALLLAGCIHPAAAAIKNEDCLACHADARLRSAAGTSVAVDPERFRASVHGQAEVSCVDCHADLKADKDFPHAEKLKSVSCAGCHDQETRVFKASVHGGATVDKDGMTVGCKGCHGTHDIRAKDDFESRTFAINLPRTCLGCHSAKVRNARGGAFVELYEKSAHYRALERAGLTLSATCSNCHGAHDIQSVKDAVSKVSRKNIIKTCGQCHVGIQRDYLEGVHGKDYVKGIKDVPVCTDCHSEHDIRSPMDLDSTVYTTKVAQVCSRCHDDMALSRQYGFAPNRMKTYANSFHGTASKFGEIRVANCASCHGFHDIRDPADPKSSIYPANLPETCGQCHPGASKHFAEGKIHNALGTTGDIRDKAPHIVKTVYLAVIAAIIGVFLLFIAADLFGRAIRRKTHG